MAAEREVWFHYRMGLRRVKAWPVSPAGWGALFGIVVGPMLPAIALVAWVVRRPELAFLVAAYWAAVLPAIFLALILVIRAKGQKVI